MGVPMNLHDDPFFAPFAGNAAVLVVAAARRMRALGLGPQDVLDRYAGIMRAARAAMTQASQARPTRPPRLARCPQCGARIHGMMVNRTRCTRVDGGYTRLHYCPACDWEEYL